jgi:hypothetical protein
LYWRCDQLEAEEVAREISGETRNDSELVVLEIVEGPV